METFPFAQQISVNAQHYIIQDIILNHQQKPQFHFVLLKTQQQKNIKYYLIIMMIIKHILFQIATF